MRDLINDIAYALMMICRLSYTSMFAASAASLYLL